MIFRMKTDKLFYRLFHAQPALVLELAGIRAPYPKGYRHRSLELKETSFRLDGVLHPPSAAWPHVFWEVQFQPDKTFYARWLASIFICLHQERITAWRGLVLFPNRSQDVGNPAPYAPLLEHGLIQRVYLEDLEHTDTETGSWGIALIRLIVAPEHRVPAIANDLLVAAADEASGLAQEEAVDLLETVLVYKLPDLSREEIRTMLHLPDTDLKETRFYREAFAEGEVQGEARGEATMLLRLLRLRFGDVPEAMRRKIESADPRTLLEWSDRVLTATSIEQVIGEND